MPLVDDLQEPGTQANVPWQKAERKKEYTSQSTVSISALRSSDDSTKINNREVARCSKLQRVGTPWFVRALHDAAMFQGFARCPVHSLLHRFPSSVEKDQQPSLQSCPKPGLEPDSERSPKHVDDECIYIYFSFK